MDWLRKIVSGKKNRFHDDNYDLDITYITPRVLGMSFPAQGIERFYRNSIEDVS
jgi:phosphatidylinositol-3,4,5-trisphosphate 3-phosphatase/dual-specificity protein phosphatase PTEN